MKIIKLGRSTTNDVVINKTVISSHHAILSVSDAGIVTIKDLNSTNGTFLNNKPVIGEVKLISGDQVRLADHIIDWEKILLDAGKTKVLPQPDQNIPQDIKEQRSIGRSSVAQIRFNHDDVSGRHATLYLKANGEILILDHNSTNGTYVNGKRVTSQVLKKGDEVWIARKYPLNWEKVFSATSKHTSYYWYGGAAAIMLIAFVGMLFFGKMTEKEIYEKYHSAVSLIYFKYGYQIRLEGQEENENIHELLGINSNDYVVWNAEQEKVVVGKENGTGTGFFISRDGKIATNLHVIKPWLFDKDAEKIAQVARNILKVMALKKNALYDTYVSQIRVIGKLTDIGVVPNGLPFTGANYHECQVYKASDDINKDVAVIQTSIHGLPAKVEHIIDIRKAVTEDQEIKQGKKIYTIGFPYGLEIAATSNGLQNQVQSGIITQQRGEYEFGHNASTAGGASGSPILDDRGRLIGVHHAGMTGVTGAQGFNRAIKAKYVCELAK